MSQTTGTDDARNTRELPIGRKVIPSIKTTTMEGSVYIVAGSAVKEEIVLYYSIPDGQTPTPEDWMKVANGLLEALREKGLLKSGLTSIIEIGSDVTLDLRQTVQLGNTASSNNLGELVGKTIFVIPPGQYAAFKQTLQFGEMIFRMNMETCKTLSEAVNRI